MIIKVRKGNNMERKELASKIDATLVRSNHTYEEIELLVKTAKELNFACVFTLPCYMEQVEAGLKGTSVHTGGVVGFPSGGNFTEVKLFEAKRCVELGATEVDMVINVGWLQSGYDRKVQDEIYEIKQIVGELPLKCIIEMSLLNDEQIERACKLIKAAGADYVKSGTGWIKGTTVDDVKKLKAIVGDDLYVKAAGGIRDIETAEAMIEAGAYRLGIGLESAIEIVKEG